MKSEVKGKDKNHNEQTTQTAQKGNVFVASVLAKNLTRQRKMSNFCENSTKRCELPKTNENDDIVSTSPIERRASISKSTKSGKTNTNTILTAVAAKKWQSRSMFKSPTNTRRMSRIDDTANHLATRQNLVPLESRTNEESGLKLNKSGAFKTMRRRSSDSNMLTSQINNSQNQVSKGALCVPMIAKKWRSKSISPCKAEKEEPLRSIEKRRSSLSVLQTSTKMMMMMSKWRGKSKMRLKAQKDSAIDEEPVIEEPEEPINSILNNGFSSDFENALKTFRETSILG